MQPHGENALNVPAFLSKLWKMVNDPTTDHLISWGQSGSTFVIENKAQFWYELLPVYYKHNNMSSFVRQLNMYGFHKISTYEGIESDKDELQFFHQYFQRHKPDLLKNIKRKVTANHKSDGATAGTAVEQSAINREEISKFLSEVTQLKGRQQTVDSQLNSMKQENAVLWRELAILRQKHLQQQKIVNKLIQFLVTLVQPSSRMGGLAQKRHYPLMIDEKPPKKAKVSSKTASVKSDASDGPIIHELETNDFLQDDLLAEATESAGNLSSNTKDSMPFIQSPDFNRDIVEELLSDSELPDDVPDEINAGDESLDLDGKIFLNANTQDTLLSNLMNGNYNAKSVSDAMAGTSASNVTTTTAAAADTTTKNDDASSAAPSDSSLAANNTGQAVATRDRVRLSRLNSVIADSNFSEDMDLHVEHTQSELESLKDILNPLLGNVPTVDANAFLTLFSDDNLPYGFLTDDLPKSDPLVCGSELTKYGNNLDFSQLFDEDTNEEAPLPSTDLPLPAESLDASGSITTPQIKTAEPSFPKV